MSKPWRQTKLYACLYCDICVLHDAMYAHAYFMCPKRPMPMQKPARSPLARGQERAAGFDPIGLAAASAK